MLRELVRQYQSLEVPIPDWLEQPSEWEKNNYIKRERRQKLVRSILNLIQDKGIKWSIAEASSLAVIILPTPDSFIAIQEITHPSMRWTGGTSYTHVLTLFEQGEEVLVLKECCDESEYTERSASIGAFPIVDLYDLATKGERRAVWISHVCGRQGFGLSPEDTCPACETREKHTPPTELPY